MPPDDLLGIGAALLILAVVLLWQQPVCPHGCAACDTDRRARDAERLRQAERARHDQWHRTKIAGCPYCK